MQNIIAELQMPKFPDFEGLAMFTKVAEERSYAGAGRSMDVSVATVLRLEDRLGGRLFNRSSRRSALTDFSRGLADRRRRVYAEKSSVSRLRHRDISVSDSGSRCRCHSERAG